MIICSRCGKENQDHYKFCLGCGAELIASEGPATATNAKSAAVGLPDPLSAARAATPGGGIGLAGEAPTEPPVDPEQATEVPAGEDTAPCPGCGAINPAAFAFCGNCGHRLQGEPEPQALASPTPSASSSSARVAAPSAAPAAIGAGSYARLALIRPDGSAGGFHDVANAEVVIGRNSGALFENDSYLSVAHARFRFGEDGATIEDVGSLNGVFVRMTDAERLDSGSIFRVGQELLRFDAIQEPEVLDDGTEILGSPNPGYWGRLSLIVGRDVDGSAFPLMGDEMILGRERGDILFSDDGYVSGMHAKVSATSQGVFLTDVGSSNGTFIRLRGPRTVPYGTYVLMGQQLFRIDAG